MARLLKCREMITLGSPRATMAQRMVKGLLVGSLAGSLGGCGTMAGKNFYDYLNPGNSFLDPSQVGRFDRDNPWGDVRPVKWPILEQLDVVDEPRDRYASATDPTPADLVADNKEYTVGPGDVLRIAVYELVQPQQEYLRDQAQVSESGSVGVQNLGNVQVAGLTTTQIEEKIGQMAVERNLLLPKGNGSQGPQVSVTLLGSQARYFTILGNVGQPDRYPISGTDFRLLNALGIARDIPGGAQPGIDYLYVLRPNPAKAAYAPTTAAPDANGPGATTTLPAGPATPTGAGGNPLDAIDSLEKNSTAPATGPASAPSSMPAPETMPMPNTTAPDSMPATVPATSPATLGPRFVRPLPMADVTSSAPASSGPALGQADLDAAMSASMPATTPATAPATMAAVPETAPATTGPSDELMNKAMGATSQPGQNVYIDGKWVTIPPVAGSTGTNGTGPATAAGPTEGPATMGGTETPTTAQGPAGPTDAFAAAEQNGGQRVIRISLSQLREGNPKENIVIRPGDTIIVPSVEQGYFYMLGHVNKPGVYALQGQKITLEMAVAAAGNLDALAIPRRCDLIRRIGPNEQVTVQVNLQAVFDGTQPDIFLKANDVVNIGTDFVAPFLAVTRNAYRASYGFGFIYDRNFYIQPTSVAR